MEDDHDENNIERVLQNGVRKSLGSKTNAQLELLPRNVNFDHLLTTEI
jgi:hypothetical protein